ncbi:hypothetical protein VTN77DRAFT_9508 [Rasamsonia byssochlamydoides]|uniref:uncharacterized protein n=1 Tax=Rasamsonia byssochlamydoides TaxID=89139 RepID=UPI003743E5E8
MASASASANFLDLPGPPRKKMRKGTKSCTECRRRKIRCTFDPGRPNVCNECHSRGSMCIDQEYGTLAPNVSGVLPGDQPYSLRERVTQLENVVRDILKRMDQMSPGSSSPAQGTTRDETEKVNNATICSSNTIPKPADAALPSPDEHVENAPVLQLFNNQVVTRTEGTSNSLHDAAATKDLPPKAIAARAQLVALIPPCADILKIRNAAAKWWAVWLYMFPEVCDGCRESLTEKDGAMCEVPTAPGEVAKFLLCLLMSLEQLPSDFDYASLQVPFDPKEYTDRCIAEIDRLIIYDDDLASTLPGIESTMLLSKWYLHMGRPRKAWLMNRRAIEFAQLTGLPLSTAKPPHPTDTLFNRRIRIWTSLVINDRFLSLILGLPYAVSDTAFKPQVEMRLQKEKPTLETYALRLALVMGQMIDRNQEDPSNMSLAATLKMEQDLETHALAMPSHFWEPDAGDQSNPEERNDRLMIQFFHHFVRALLHLPFMLKSTGDRRYRYSHEAAIESSRSTLVAYNALRSWSGINPYICRVIDFQAFTVAMLLIIHLLGYSEDAPGHSQAQDDRDWALVNETTEVLRKAAQETAGTVAAQSVHVLDSISNCKCSPDMISPNLNDMSCKITVPYFGVITVSAGKKLSTLLSRSRGSHLAGHASSLRSSDQASPSQLYTPPQSNPGDHASNREPSSGNSAMASEQTTTWTPPFADESRIQLENMVAFPNAGMDQSMFQGFLNDQNIGLWPNLNLDLDLDQGWNLNWTEDGGAGITQ